ncbi:MAG: hypothetical protein L6R40_000652 [Gallowayella cf. fulva]|nr:MAG: hypothetical protein L6R40_000652 [Xanthomendoza cf. fulva]
MSVKAEVPLSSLDPSLSLFDELFPEETEQLRATALERDHDEIHIPRLPLSDIDHLDPYPPPGGSPKGASKKETEVAAHGAVKQWNPAVLVLNRASKSLMESDFRRIAPKGRHISEWTGPGDILKVIPARETNTFQQTNSYFLLFPNPAYARTYQNYVTKLHRMAQTHTPTSLQSPLPPAPGTILEGEDLHALLQDYSLCPPSQRINILSMFAPFGATIRRLIKHQGYPELTEPFDRTGRSVLFWIEGHSLTTNAVRSALDEDGRQRGLQWATQVGNRYVERLDLPNSPLDDPDRLEDREPEVRKHDLFLFRTIMFEAKNLRSSMRSSFGDVSVEHRGAGSTGRG